MTATGYGLFDVDNHYYETADAFSRYLDPKYLDLLPRTVGSAAATRQPGQEDWVMRPGSLKEYLRKMKTGSEEEPYVPMPPLPGFHNRAPGELADVN